MSIQFLLVTYPDSRAVLADGASVGFTNHMLMLPSDGYLITLEGGAYKPASQDIVLAGTSMVKPMVLAFLPAAAGAMPDAATITAVTTTRSGSKKSDAKDV